MKSLIMWTKRKEEGYHHDCKECRVRNMGKWHGTTVLTRTACDHHKSEVRMKKLGMRYPALSSAWYSTIVGSDG